MTMDPMHRMRAIREALAYEHSNMPAVDHNGQPTNPTPHDVVQIGYDGLPAVPAPPPATPVATVAEPAAPEAPQPPASLFGGGGDGGPQGASMAPPTLDQQIAQATEKGDIGAVMALNGQKLGAYGRDHFHEINGGPR